MKQKKSDLLGELLKNIKNKDEFDELREQLFKRGVETS